MLEFTAISQERKNLDWSGRHAGNRNKWALSGIRIRMDRQHGHTVVKAAVFRLTARRFSHRLFSCNATPG